MKRIIAQDADIAMGIDAGKSHLTITVVANGEVVKQATIAYSRVAIESFLSRFSGCRIRAAYEAGCFGYWLADTLRELGVMVTVTPPSKLERAPGDKVKTERRDSRRLGEQLAAGRLKAVAIPTEAERATRQLVRTYGQLKRTRGQAMCRITSFLEFHHVLVPREVGRRWTKRFLHWLETLSFADRPEGKYLRLSLDQLLLAYRNLTVQVNELKKEVGRMAETPRYKRAATVLAANDGIGELSAMIILTETQNVGRFRISQRFTSNLGLTPSEHSTGDQQHRGHITKAGNRHIRGILIQCAWAWIRKDAAARARYRRLSRLRGPKRAIVAMARRLAVKIYWQLRAIHFGQRSLASETQRAA